MRGNTVSEEIYQINCRFDGQLPVEEKEESTTAKAEEKSD